MKSSWVKSPSFIRWQFAKVVVMYVSVGTDQTLRVYMTRRPKDVFSLHRRINIMWCHVPLIMPSFTGLLWEGLQVKARFNCWHILHLGTQTWLTIHYFLKSSWSGRLIVKIQICIFRKNKQRQTEYVCFAVPLFYTALWYWDCECTLGIQAGRTYWGNESGCESSITF